MPNRDPFPQESAWHPRTPILGCLILLMVAPWGCRTSKKDISVSRVQSAAPCGSNALDALSPDPLRSAEDLKDQDAFLASMTGAREHRLFNMQKLGLPADTVDRVLEIANRIKFDESGEILFHFLKSTEKWKSQIQDKVNAGKLPDLLKDPNWRRRNIHYMYPGKFAVNKGKKGGTPSRGIFDSTEAYMEYLEKTGMSTVLQLPFFHHGGVDNGYDLINPIGIDPSIGNLTDVYRYLQTALGNGKHAIGDVILNHVSIRHDLIKRIQSGQTQLLKYIVHSWEKPRYESITKDGQLYARYFDKNGKFLHERMVDMSDLYDNHWRPLEISDGRTVWVYHNFFDDQVDLASDHPGAVRMGFDIYGFWANMGWSGFRNDAVPFLVQHDGGSGLHTPETHALLELMNLFVQSIRPGAGFLNEAVMGIEESSKYLGRQSRFGDFVSGSEGNMFFNFEQAIKVKASLLLGDVRHFWKYIGQRKRKTPLPEGTVEVMPITTHDQIAAGFVDESLRKAFNKKVLESGGYVFHEGFSSVSRLADLFSGGRKIRADSKELRRYKGAFKAFLSFEATPGVYYGDLLGKRNDWPGAWRAAIGRFWDISAQAKGKREYLGRIESGEIEMSPNDLANLKEEVQALEDRTASLREVLARADQKKAPEARDRETVLTLFDFRNVNRGDVTEADMLAAMNGENPVANAVMPLPGMRERHPTLFRGGPEEIADVWHKPDVKNEANWANDVLSFFRGAPSGSQSGDVLVLSNISKRARKVYVSLDKYARKSGFRLREIETGRIIEPVFGEGAIGRYMEIPLEQYETMWLEVIPG